VITLEQCGKTLNQNGKHYNNEEIKMIRDYLYFIGGLELELDNNNKNLESHECNHLL